MVRLVAGDRVTVAPNTYERAGSWASTNAIRIREGSSAPLRITRVFAERVIVRGPVLGGEEASFYVWRNAILTVNDATTATGELERPLGTKPADTPDVPFRYIGIDDPGIQWLFQDMAQYADDKGWCSTYDDLAVDLGIPPREREYSVSHTHNGVMVYATIRARDEETAQSKLIEMFA